MLSLADRAKSPKRVTEKSFEDAFAKALRACGLENWHINARDAGWPDRYVHTGIWIEFKVLERITDDRLEIEQKMRMGDLSRAGEPVWYCALFYGEVILCRYPFIIPISDVKRFKYRDNIDLQMMVRKLIQGEA